MPLCRFWVVFLRSSVRGSMRGVFHRMPFVVTSKRRRFWMRSFGVDTSDRSARAPQSACGRAYRGGVRDTGTAAASRQQGRTRPLPAEGGPDNPVIDETTARLLRERFGEEEPGPDG